jgi:DinB superfamily
MTTNEVIIENLRNGLGLLKSLTSDLSDADLIQRPVPAANNALWQIGHLIGAEAWMVNHSAGSTIIELPAGFTERYSKETTKVDDPAKLGTKADLLALFEKVRGQTVKWAESLPAADWSKATPEPLSRFAPTVGHMLSMIPSHVAMHVGQIQVLRRKLGKPVMF